MKMAMMIAASNGTGHRLNHPGPQNISATQKPRMCDPSLLCLLWPWVLEGQTSFRLWAFFFVLSMKVVHADPE